MLRGRYGGTWAKLCVGDAVIVSKPAVTRIRQLSPIRTRNRTGTHMLYPTVIVHVSTSLIYQSSHTCPSAPYR